MRVWDLHPGYLNRQSLLGEHRELHGIVSILVHGKKGYANHPETLRWVGFGWALKQRHQLLAKEMHLRGYQDQSPVRTRTLPLQWPEVFIDSPAQQIALLREKYQDKEPGRIPLPGNAQQLWAQHKYSVMARDYEQYKKIGKQLASRHSRAQFESLALELIEILRLKPSETGLRNTLQHMWGYVSENFGGDASQINHWPNGKLLSQIQQLTRDNPAPYLQHSTALSELAVWI